LKRIAEAFRAARKIEIVLLAVFIAVLLAIILDQGAIAPSVASEAEIRLERLLSRIEGAGNVKVMLSGEEGAYSGCVVVADGAQEVQVSIKILRAVQAAMSIPAENIEIISSGG